MKLLLSLSILLFCANSSNAQTEKFTGNWYGTLNVGSALTIVFHITQSEKGKIVSTIDSPDQYAFGIKCDTTLINKGEITIEIKNLGASFTGRLVNDSVISGKFVQQIEIPLTLTKKTNPSSTYRERPLIPQTPSPYNIEDNNYLNKNSSIKFRKMITTQKGDCLFPGILLVTTPISQNRNEKIQGYHNYSAVIDYLHQIDCGVIV